MIKGIQRHLGNPEARNRTIRWLRCLIPLATFGPTSLAARAPSTLNFFPPLTDASSPPSGLSLDPDFLSPTESAQLLTAIDQGNWVPIGGNEGARRVQQFGAHYDHRAAAVQAPDPAPWPTWCLELGQKVVDHAHLPSPPEQAIINEYLPGQGIASHIDHPEGFGPIVVSITLGSPVTMDLTHPEEQACWSQVLGVGSALVLSGEARYDWKHGIAKRSYDMIDGHRVERSRRVSVTFRTLNLNQG